MIDFCTTAVVRTGNVSCKSSLYGRGTVLKGFVDCDVILGRGYELCADVTKGREGVNLALKCVTSFMDGPLSDPIWHT